MRQLTAAQADDLYELVSERQGRCLIITSNRAPSDWYPLFPNPVVAESLLDRLINTSHQVIMNGPSYRRTSDPKLHRKARQTLKGLERRRSGQQLGNAVGDLDEPCRITVLAAPLGSHHCAGLDPAADALAVEFGSVGEDGQATQQSGFRVIGGEQVLEPAPHQRDRVEGRVTDISLGVDGQPRLSLGPQHVPEVQVAMDERVRLVATEFSDGRDRCLHDALRQRTRQPLGAVEKVLLPSRNLIAKAWQVGWGLDGKPPSELTGHGHGLVDIVETDQGAVPGLLQQHGKARVVTLVQQHGTASAPDREGVRFVDVAGMGERDLQDRGRSVS